MALRIVILGGLLVCGCGRGNEGLVLHRVQGVVSQDGQPLSGVNVSLLPRDTDTRAPALRALTTDDGEFVVKTGSGQPGAPAGDYRVVLSIAPRYDYASPSKPSQPNPIPKQFSDVRTTPLSFSVAPSNTNVLNIVVKSPSS